MMTHSTTDRGAGLRTKYRCVHLAQVGDLLPKVRLVCPGWQSKDLSGPEALAVLRAVAHRIAASGSRAVLEIEFPHALEGLYLSARSLPAVRASLEGEVHHG